MEKLNYINRYERVMKDLDKLIPETRKAFEACQTLEEKLEIGQVQTNLENFRHSLRKFYFVAEDITSILDKN